MTPSLHSTPLSRRSLLGAALAGAAGTAVVVAAGTEPAHAADAVTLAGDGYSLVASGMTVTLRGADGDARLLLGGYRFGAVKPAAGTAVLGSAPDGTPAVVVDYVTGVEGTSVRGTFTPRGRRLEVVFDMTAPAGTSMSSGTLRRQAVPTSVVETFSGVPRWTRDERGGVPFEADAVTVFEEAFEGDHVYLVLPGSNASWRDPWSMNLPGKELSPGVFRATADLLVSPPVDLGTARTLATGLPLGVTLSTDRPFNLWDSAASPLVVDGVVSNGGGAKTVTVRWTVRDWDGEVVAARRTVHTVAPGGTVDTSVSFTLPGRGIAFAELSADCGDDTAFARINVALLPPHSYTETWATSSIGLASDYLKDTEAERALIKRLGMRWGRHPQFTPEQLAALGMRQNRLRTPPSPTAFVDDPAGLAAYIEEEINTAERQQAAYYELANEWNMRGGVLSGQGGAEYVANWAAPFKARLRERGSKIKLMSVALAGMDHVYASRMFDAGLADHVDAFALHPGRGNFTPDFAPTPDQWTSGSEGSYWNFLGAVREARRMLDERAPHLELWLTEAYSSTLPNRWWKDTYRQSAEHALLTHLLALSEGVRQAQWFQFYDSRKANPTGVKPDDHEYHYGIVMRDHSPKPSLLGLAAAAEHLDGARFVRWLDLGDEDTKGLLFDTPRGPLTALWSRADGYVLNTEGRDGSFFPAPEPWEDVWKTKVPLTLPAAGQKVRQIDTIGRETTIPVRDGVAELVLDGSPRLYYGLQVEEVAFAVEVDARTVGGVAHLAVRATNEEATPVTVVVESPYGTRTIPQVAPGATVRATFEKRGRAVPNGSVTVTATRADDGREIRFSRTVRYVGR